jgi:DNA-binding transcriptional MerR regulator
LKIARTVNDVDYGAAVEDLLAISAVARELGVSPSTLRSWERRYRLVVAHRDERGQRLYDRWQLDTLRGVVAAMQSGCRARTAHENALALATCAVLLAPTKESPRLAREAVDALLGADCDARFRFNLRLVASELVKNAVLYGSGEETVALDLRLLPLGAELRVRNHGARLRLASLRGRRRNGGRGLEIVDALAEGLSIETGSRGTSVTALLLREPARSSSPPQATAGALRAPRRPAPDASG